MVLKKSRLISRTWPPRMIQPKSRPMSKGGLEEVKDDLKNVASKDDLKKVKGDIIAAIIRGLLQVD